MQTLISSRIGRLNPEAPKKRGAASKEIESSAPPVPSRTPEAVNPPSTEKQGEYREIPVADISASPFNRTYFDPGKMAELVASVRLYGVIEPIIVRPSPKGQAVYFELIAGERRWTAAVEAGLELIPAIIRRLDDRETIELQITENLQREDVRPLDEARSYRQLEDLGYSADQIAEKVQRSKSGVYGRLKLLELPESIRGEIDAGKLPASHAELLTRLEHPGLQIELLREFKHTGWREEGQPVIPFRNARNVTDSYVAREKNLREAEKKKQEYRVKGFDVLEPEESEKLFQYGDELRGNSGFTKIDAHDGPGNMQWSKLIKGKDRPAPVLAIARDGKPVEIYRRADLVEAAKSLGIVAPKKAESPEAAANRKLKAERARHDLNIDAIVLRAEALGDSDEFVDYLVNALLGQCGSNQCARTGKRRGLVAKLDGGLANAALAKWAAEATRKQKRGLVVELLAQIHYPHMYSRDDGLVRVAEQFGAEIQASGKEGK